MILTKLSVFIMAEVDAKLAISSEKYLKVPTISFSVPGGGRAELLNIGPSFFYFCPTERLIFFSQCDSLDIFFR